ncbi:hypothetical protein BDB01DRAFT_157092 [Pilobolus umbonatus]|nr:hypothetical protein BDB01DRAFT_157092 [Pilobolus umbonatus]
MSIQSPTYGIRNILANDCTVYCSQKPGVINILLRYSGWEGSKDQGKRLCHLSHIIIKSPEYGFTAPCKEGMIFLSHEPIDVEATRVFDYFGKDNFDRYTNENKDLLTEEDPMAWFSIEEEGLSVVELEDKACKYVLIKLLRSDYVSENMDLQYVGFIGYTGHRSFGSARLQ